jgi:hypothetical protein
MKKNSMQSTSVTREEHIRASSVKSFDISHTFLASNPYKQCSTWDCTHSYRSHFINHSVQEWKQGCHS